MTRWLAGVTVLALLLVPAAADAKRRPGAPKSSKVVRTLDSLVRSTTFASGRAAARKARRRFAKGKTCAAANALARHHAQATRRSRRGRSARYVKLAGRSARARALVLASRPKGKGCGGRPSLGVDGSVDPQSGELPAVGDSGPRPLARIEDASGGGADFVANELLVTGDEADVAKVVKRWKGRILATIDLSVLGGEGKQFLVRIDASRADEKRLAADLAALVKGRGGAGLVSSGAGLDLLAAAARERRAGTQVGINFVAEGSAIAAGGAVEDPRGPDGFATTGPGWDSNPFNWTHMSATSTQGTGTAAAWQLLARSGRTENKVGLAVLDMGFIPRVNGSDFGEPLTSISNVPFTDALETENILDCGNPCPWHGTNVANTAFSVVDDNKGVAGTGGPVAKRIVVFTLYDFFTSIAALGEARLAGARVINMSYGVPVPFYLAWSVLPFELATIAVRGSGAVLIAAAGNDNSDVDAEDCFFGCWEEAWWTPCENAGVMCVGAIEHDGKKKASYSNWGAEQVDLFAPGTVVVGFDPATHTDEDSFGVHRVQGTSFAAPYLAGVAALVRAADPGMGAGAVETLLKNSAHTSPDAKVKRYVNTLEAVRRALPALVNIERPIQGSSIDKGTAIEFSAFVFDDGAGAPTSIVWRHNGAQIGTGATFSTSALGYGPKRVTVEATLPGGGRLSDVVDFTVSNTAPGLRIAQPAPGETFYRNETLALLGESADVNQPESGYRLRDDQVAWYLDGSPTPFDTGHAATLDLSGVSVGSHSVTLRGTDDAGAITNVSVLIDVQPASANPPPSVQITSPANNSAKPGNQNDANGYYAEFDFLADVSDPNGDPLTYTWTETNVPHGSPVTRFSVEDPGVQKVYMPANPCTSQGLDYKLSVSDGVSTRTSTVRIGFSDVIC